MNGDDKDRGGGRGKKAEEGEVDLGAGIVAEEVGVTHGAGAERGWGQITRGRRTFVSQTKTRGREELIGA